MSLSERIPPILIPEVVFQGEKNENNARNGENTRKKRSTKFKTLNTAETSNLFEKTRNTNRPDYNDF